MRYLHFEKAFLNGELDPAFRDMTAWECRFIVNSKAQNSDLAWGREMLRNYRPDTMLKGGYTWRYTAFIGGDVPYRRHDPGLEGNTFYQNIPHTAGVCGRRAFFARFLCRTFGIPAFGVRQRGHAACGHWRPGGWTVNLGAGWTWSWWDRPGHNVSGKYFLLQTKARERPQAFRKALRAQWVGDAFGEKDVQGRELGSGGLWNALALYKKRAAVKDGKPPEAVRAGEHVAEGDYPGKAENMIKELKEAEISDAARKVQIARNGVVTIPAAAASKPAKSKGKIKFTKSFLGGMQMYHKKAGKNPQTFEYTFTLPDVPEQGTYELTAKACTVRNGQKLSLKVNGADKPVEMPVPYTVGMWEKSEPVEVSLEKGENKLSFTPPKGKYRFTIKKFNRTPVK